MYWVVALAVRLGDPHSKTALYGIGTLVKYFSKLLCLVKTKRIAAMFIQVRKLKKILHMSYIALCINQFI